MCSGLESCSIATGASINARRGLRQYRTAANPRQTLECSPSFTYASPSWSRRQTIPPRMKRDSCPTRAKQAGSRRKKTYPAAA